MKIKPLLRGFYLLGTLAFHAMGFAPRRKPKAPAWSFKGQIQFIQPSEPIPEEHFLWDDIDIRRHIDALGQPLAGRLVHQGDDFEAPSCKE